LAVEKSQAKRARVDRLAPARPGHGSNLMSVNTKIVGGDLVFGISIRAELLASDWSSCGRIANYAASLVSHRRVDPLRYANLFSSVVNELLETAFRRHGSAGDIVCKVYRGTPRDSIEISVPCDAATREFYEAAVAQSSRDDVTERYVDALLLGEPQNDPGIGLLELAADYQARLALETGVQDRLTLTVELVLDEATC
jgi:hypothetical protein